MALSAFKLIDGAAVPLYPLTTSAAAYLQPELEYRLRFVIQEARKLAEHSFRKVLTREDIEDAALMICGSKVQKASIIQEPRLPGDEPTLTASEITVAPSLTALMKPSVKDLGPAGSSDVRNLQHRNAIAAAISSHEPMALLQLLQQCIRNHESGRALSLLQGLVRQSELATHALRAAALQKDVMTSITSVLNGLVPPILALLQSEQEDCMRSDDVAAHLVVVRILHFLVEQPGLALTTQIDDFMSILVSTLVHRSDAERLANLPTAATMVQSMDSVGHLDKKAAWNVLCARHGDIYSFDGSTPTKRSLHGKVDSHAPTPAHQYHLRLAAARVLAAFLTKLGPAYSNVRATAAAVLVKVLLSPLVDQNTYLSSNTPSTLPSFDGEMWQSWLPAASPATLGCVLGIAATGPGKAISIIGPIACRLSRALDTFVSCPQQVEVFGAKGAHRSVWLTWTLQCLCKVMSAAVVATTPTAESVQSGQEMHLGDLTSPTFQRPSGGIQVIVLKLPEAVKPATPHPTAPALTDPQEEVATKAPVRASKRKAAASAVSAVTRQTGKRGRHSEDTTNESEPENTTGRSKRARTVGTSNVDNATSGEDAPLLGVQHVTSAIGSLGGVKARIALRLPAGGTSLASPVSSSVNAAEIDIDAGEVALYCSMMHVMNDILL